MQQQPTTDLIEFPSEQSIDLLTPILREGAQKMLATARVTQLRRPVHQQMRAAQLFSVRW